MLNHIGLRVSDLSASRRFYQAVLKPLGYETNYQDAATAGFGPQGRTALWLHAAQAPQTGAHIAFDAPDKKAVKAFHAAGLKAGGKDNGAAGLRADYSAGYYAAFLIDPDGNNVEAVFMDTGA
jgi:catechol 2,3-dioxygenase-like lactoylglutathione lyase family enzyme